MIRFLSLTLVLICGFQGQPETMDDLEARLRIKFPPLVFILNLPGVDREIELSEDQIESLRQQVMDRRNHPRPTLPKVIRQRSDLTSENSEEVEIKDDPRDETIRQILLPHQINRLREIRAQMYADIAKDSTFGIPQFLKLNEAEAGQIRLLAEQHDEEIVKFLKKLRETLVRRKKQALDDQLSVLTADQRKLFDQTVGELFISGDQLESWGRKALVVEGLRPDLRKEHAEQAKQKEKEQGLVIRRHQFSADIPSGPNLVQLLSKRGIADELELTPEQKTGVIVEMGLYYTSERQAMEKFQSGQGGPSIGIFELDQLPLSAQQRNRLLQIYCQTECQLVSDPMLAMEILTDYLSLTPGQMSAMKASVDDAEGEFREDVLAMLNELQNIRNRQFGQSIAMLSESQRDAMRVLGDPYWLGSWDVTKLSLEVLDSPQ